jgi:hypothetical protein
VADVVDGSADTGLRQPTPHPTPIHKIFFVVDASLPSGLARYGASSYPGGSGRTQTLPGCSTD